MCAYLPRAPAPPALLQLGMGETQMLDKILYEEEVRRCIETYEQQFHYGVFYAYMRLRWGRRGREGGARRWGSAGRWLACSCAVG